MAKAKAPNIERKKKNTPRKEAGLDQVESPFQDSEKTLRNVLQTLMDGVVQVNLKGEIIFANRAAQSILGIEEVEGKFFNSREWTQLDEFDHPYPSDQLPLAIAIREQRPVEAIEHAIVAPDGEKKWLTVNAAPLFDEHGKLYGAIAGFQDITKRKKTEQQLIINTRAIESMDQGVVISDPCQPNNPIIYCNQGFTAITGYTQADVLGKNANILHGSATDPKVIAQIETCIKAQIPFAGEILNYKKDGTPFWNQLRISYIFNEQGKMTHVVGLQSDISAHKKVETQYQTLVEQNPAIIYTSGLHQHIGVTYVSPRIRTLGFTQEEWIADPDLWLKQIHPEDRKRVIEEIELYSKNGNPFHSEYRLMTRNGEVRWFLDEAVDVFDDHGIPLIHQGFMLDITARKNAEKALSAREQYLALLNQTTAQIITAQDLETMQQELVRNVKELLGADACYMTRWDEAEGKVIPLSSTVKMEQPYQQIDFPANLTSMTSSVIREGRVLVAEDVFNSPHISPELAKRFPARSMLGIPMLYGSTKLGAILMAYNTTHTFEQDEIERAEHAGRQIAIALWSVEQDFELKRRVKEQSALTRITTLLSQTEHIGLANLLTLIVDSARELIPAAQQAVIHLMDKSQTYLIPEAVSGYESFDGNRGKLRVGEGIAGLVVTERNSIYIPSIDKDERFIAVNPNAKYRSLLVSPIISGSQILGTISIQSEKPYAFSKNEIHLLSELGQQAAIAIENARLYAAEHEQRLLAETSADATLALISHTEREKVLYEILNQVQKLIPGCGANIALLEGDFLRTAAWRGYENRGEGIFKELVKHTHLYPMEQKLMRNPRPLLVQDTHNDADWKIIPGLEWIRSHLCIPLLWNKELLGFLYIDEDAPNKFTEETANRLTPLVNATTVALESAILIETTRKALSEISALYHINKGLVALDTDELLQEAVELLRNNFNYYHVQVFVIDQETGNLILKAASGEVGKKMVENRHEIRAGAGIIGYAAETGTPFFTNNVHEVVFFISNPNLPETNAEMAIPIRNGDQLYGILDIQQTAARPFTQSDQQLVMTVADQIAVALHKAELYKNLQTALQQEKTIRNQMIQNERLAVMGRLLASVSHELNNPLQAIQNALFLLKEEKGMSQQGVNDLEIVIAESERMASMIERLRDTYRPPQAEDLQPTYLNTIIEDVYALLATHLRKNQVIFEFHPDPAMPAIFALPDQIRQVALNLMINAVEAMPNGGKLTVSTMYLHTTKEVMMSVADTGTGIPASILPYIFDPFITNKKRGTGIGLTISHDIVIKHRGRITAENNHGELGATFNVWLPVGQAPAEVE